MNDRPPPSEDWEGLRRTIAELLEQDPETWPGHGNAPLAIAAAFALLQGRMRRLGAELTQARGEIAGAYKALADLDDTERAKRILLGGSG